MSKGSANELDWNIDGIVAELRRLRDAALEARQRIGKPAKLPSRKALAAIVEGLSAALFPNRLGSRVLANESLDYFVGHTLDVAAHATSSSRWFANCNSG